MEIKVYELIKHLFMITVNNKIIEALLKDLFITSKKYRKKESKYKSKRENL